MLGLGLAGCYLLTADDVREHDEGLAPPPPTEGDADADADADADSDADADTDDTAPPGDGNDRIELATRFDDALDPFGTCLGGLAIDPGDDVDYYEVTGAAPGDLVWIWTRAALKVPASDLDTRLELVDADDVLVRASDDLPFDLATDSVVLAEADDAVFVRVRAQEVAAVADPTYELCAATAPPTEVEDNQTITPYSTPQQVAWPVAGGVIQVVGEVAGNADLDIHRFTTDLGDTSQWALVDGHGLDAPRLALYDTKDQLVGVALASATTYDPGPSAAGYPIDAALMYTNDDVRGDAGVHVEVGSAAQPQPGKYVLLRRDLGPAFDLELEPNDLPDGSNSVLPDFDGVAWTLSVAGRAGLGVDPLEFVQLDVSGIPSIDTRTLTVHVQGRSVGTSGVVVQVFGETGYFLVAGEDVPADPVDDPVVLAEPLADHVTQFETQLQFQIDAVGLAHEPWYLTVRIE